MKTIFFSASQQGLNRYHCLNMTEKQYCESLVDLLMERLPSNLKGICNHGLDYTKRPAYAKAQGADIYLTIHTNGFTGKARGMEIGTSGSGQDKPLAEAIYHALEPLTPAADRGIKKYTFLEAVQPVMPSCYVELSFHDNHEDELWLTQNQTIIADGIITGLCNYLGIAPSQPPAAPQDGYTAQQYNSLKAERDAAVELADSLEAKLHNIVEIAAQA